MAINIPGLDLLKEAFKKFADKHGGVDLAAKATRSVAAGAQAVVDKGLTEFPKAYVKEAATDFFSMVTSQEVADGVSQAARSFDEEKVKEKLDQLMLKLQEPELSLKVATQIKALLAKSSNESIEQGLDQALASRSDGEQMIAKELFEQFKPVLDGMRNGTNEEVAEQVRDIAATIPTDAIAMQVAGLTREVTPERVSQQAHDLVGKLPSPKTVSDIVHGVGELASDKLGKLAAAPDVKEGVKTALTEFVTEAQTVVKAKLANDNDSKRNFKKGGQDHSL